MKKLLLALSVIITVFIVVPTHSFAGTKPAAKVKATPVPHRTTIGSISSDSITVNEPKGSKTYKITKETVIEFKGQTKTASDLTPGMRVSITVGSNPDVASRISASDAPK